MCWSAVRYSLQIRVRWERRLWLHPVRACTGMHRRHWRIGMGGMMAGHRARQAAMMHFCWHHARIHLAWYRQRSPIFRLIDPIVARFQFEQQQIAIMLLDMIRTLLCNRGAGSQRNRDETDTEETLRHENHRNGWTTETRNFRSGSKSVIRSASNIKCENQILVT